MLVKRNSKERGYADHGWLQSYHTFSFANYYDPNQMGFRSLRVINEDQVQGGKGFGTHSHRDMEIITYVLDGHLEHQDILGNRSVIERGKIQRMSAGTGISHSEYNASSTELVHFFQIWILPNQTGIEPSYEEKVIDLSQSLGKFQPIVTPTGSGDTISVHQDMTLSVARLPAQTTLTQSFDPSRYGWLQVSKGQLQLNDLALGQGDGVAIAEESLLTLTASEDAEVLLFDLN